MRKNLIKREPFSDTQLLMTITIGIFVIMYLSAMGFLGGGFLHFQQICDMLNDNASLIIVSCGLTIVMIGGGIDISVGAVTSLVVMSCVLYLNNDGNIIVSILLALGIGLAFGLVHGFLISYLEIQPFIVTLAGMFFARGMTTVVNKEPFNVSNPGLMSLKDTHVVVPFLGRTNRKGVYIDAYVEVGVIVAIVLVILMFALLRWSKLGRNFYAVGGHFILVSTKICLPLQSF